MTFGCILAHALCCMLAMSVPLNELHECTGLETFRSAGDSKP